MFDYAVLPGRMQPPHSGHVSLIAAGLQQAHTVIVVCTGDGLSRSILRPWTAPERIAILQAILPTDTASRVRIVAAADNPYRPHHWAATLRRVVDGVIRDDGNSPHDMRVALLTADPGSRRDYARCLPQWARLECQRNEHVTSAALRAELFGLPASTSPRTDVGLAECVTSAIPPDVFAVLCEEFAANERFRARWAAAPWPPVFVTVDAVVVAGSSVLLIERGRFPGRGLWALPGGFLDPGERLRDACVRELVEETAINCREAVLLDAIRDVEVFDAPERSARGRTITHAFRFELDGPAPDVQGGDDAAAARWVAVADLQSPQMFEDHYAILQAMLGVE